MWLFHVGVMPADALALLNTMMRVEAASHMQLYIYPSVMFHISRMSHVPCTISTCSAWYHDESHHVQVLSAA